MDKALPKPDEAPPLDLDRDLDSLEALADEVDESAPDDDASVPERDGQGRLRRIADTGLALGKQATDGAASAGRKAANVAGPAGVAATRAVSAATAAAASSTASAARTIGSGAISASASGGRAVASSTRRVFDATIERTSRVLSAAQALIASDLSPAINEVTAAAVKGAPTIYDKAMDAVYLETHIGGGYHRLFDGGHTIGGAVQAAHGASTDDTLIQEVLGTIQGLLRDVSTKRGLPLANWDKDTFDSVARSLQENYGIPKSWFHELNTYDAADLLGGTVGVATVIFGWNRADTETFARLAASIGMSTALSTNPLLMPVAVIALARAFHKANTADEYADLADGAFKGAVASGSSLGAIALVGVAGGPAGVALLAGVAAGVLAHTATKNVELASVRDFVKDEASTVIRTITQQSAVVGDVIAEHADTTGQFVVQGAATASSFVKNLRRLPPEDERSPDDIVRYDERGLPTQATTNGSVELQ